jgi:hypothetical protein
MPLLIPLLLDVVLKPKVVGKLSSPDVSDKSINE